MKNNDIAMPTPERLRRGPVAILDCPEEISCNPCATVCKVHAIALEDVESCPEIDFDKCIGCGRCVQICPGLAVYMLSYSGEKAILTTPYEYLPIPEPGQSVDVLDCAGKRICEGRVLSVIGRDRSIGDTPTVTFEVPIEFGMDARDILVR